MTPHCPMCREDWYVTQRHGTNGGEWRRCVVCETIWLYNPTRKPQS